MISNPERVHLGENDSLDSKGPAGGEHSEWLNPRLSSRTSLSRLLWKGLRPSHRKPARFVKEIPDQNFLGERHVPVEHFIGLPAPRQSGPGGRRLTSRGAPRGHPVSQPPTRKEAHLRYVPERGTKQNLPRLTHPETPGGRWFQATPEKFRPPGLRARSPASARRGGQIPPGAPGPGSGRVSGASALTSGKKLSIVPGRSATCPSPASGSRKSAQQTVPGNHACHGATPRNPSPRGSPAAIALTPSRLSHLLFAQTQVSNSSVPTAAFVSLPPSSLLLGAALASGEQLVAHSSPGLGERGGGLGSAPPPSALRRRR